MSTNTGLFFGDFECETGVFDAFNIAQYSRTGIEILYAIGESDTRRKSIKAVVLYRRYGQLLLVSVDVCSCSACGLQRNWKPVPTTVAEMLSKIEQGELPDFEFYHYIGLVELLNAINPDKAAEKLLDTIHTAQKALVDRGYPIEPFEASATGCGDTFKALIREINGFVSGHTPLSTLRESLHKFSVAFPAFFATVIEGSDGL